MAKDFSKSTGAKALNAVARKSSEAANAGIVIMVNDSDLVDFSENVDMGFDLTNTEDLEVAIEQNGFTDPLEIIPLDNGKYEIRSGHRRRIAGRNKGMTSFPAIVKENLGDTRNRRAVLEANFHRELSPMQYAKLIAAWEEQLKRESYKGDKRKYISKILKLSEATISRYNSLNKMVPSFQELVEDGRMGLSSISAIAKFSEQEQNNLYGLINDYLETVEEAPGEDRYELITRDIAKEIIKAYEEGIRSIHDLQIEGQININDPDFKDIQPPISSPHASSYSEYQPVVEKNVETAKPEAKILLVENKWETEQAAYQPIETLSNETKSPDTPIPSHLEIAREILKNKQDRLREFTNVQSGSYADRKYIESRKVEVKNLHVKVDGGVSDGIEIKPKQLEVIITNDSVGKSISIHDGEKMFTIPFEPIEKFLR